MLAKSASRAALGAADAIAVCSCFEFAAVF